MEILRATDRLDDFIHNAPSVPYTDQVRVDKRELHDLVRRVRAEATTLFGSEPERSGPIGQVLDALDGLDELVAAAKGVPLTDQVRVNKERMFEPMDRLRASAPYAAEQSAGATEGSPPAWSAVLEDVDALEDRIREFERRFNPWWKIDASVLRDGLARVRISATQNLGPPGGPSLAPLADFYAALDELDALVGDAGHADRVRVRSIPLLVLVDRLRRAAVDAGLRA